MILFRTVLAGLLLAALAPAALAAPVNFSGNWSIDLRSETQRGRKVECGVATFILTQAGDQISGEHTFATPGCSRLNEGGDGTVKGLVVGSTAVLVVTSGRNGAILLGRARLQGERLEWETVDDVHPGEPEGDSPLILAKGTLTRQILNK